MNTPKFTGKAWDQLEEKVDSLVETLMEEKSLPGMTVAVTKGGRLLLSKGYGYALVDGTRKLPMNPCSRSKIGSTTKALITGPSGYQLMKSKNIDPKSTKLYGPKGFFGGIFDADIDIGIKAHAPKSAQWKKWYEMITIQHLLDHKAGFRGDKDEGDPTSKDMAKQSITDMFGVPENEVTLEQRHRHFLRTCDLRYEPGNPPPNLQTYLNHGFGMWALLIPKMSGKPYRNYVRGHYLKPLKLHNAVRWQRASPDSCDAYGHFLNDNQQPKKYKFGESTLNSSMGLAAGGWVASAESMLRLTASLDKKYTTEELDSMGWFSNSGKLEHNGKIDGGASYVAMYKNSEIHVAVATNVGSVDGLESLSNDIVLAVPTSNVPANFDLWKQDKSVCSCEYAQHGVPASEYQEVFDDADRSGYRLEWIDGYTDNGKVHFNVIFRTNEPEIAWVSHHNMTGATYQENFDKYRDEGFSLDHVDSYAVGNNVLYAAIWTKSSGAFTAYHGKTAEEHQESFDSLKSEGWRPKVISVASVGGKLRYTALYTKQSIGNFEARSSLTPDEYQTKFDENKAKGRRPYYLNSYVHEGKLRFSAIWTEKPEVSAYQARHGLTAEEFWTHWEDVLSTGFRTEAITAYEVGGKIRYAAYWVEG